MALVSELLIAKLAVCRVQMLQNVNTCPVDRQVFRLILVRDGCEGVVYRRIPVAHHELHVDDEPVPDITFCEVCGRADREDRLLLCDGCDLGLVMFTDSCLGFFLAYYGDLYSA